MPKNLPLELMKIEDFIMEDERFENLDDWVNHVIEDLRNIAYRQADGELDTTTQNATNLKLTGGRKDALIEDLKYRFNRGGETSRLIDIERSLIGKYKISIVDEATKHKRREVLDKFLEYFNTTPITNQNDPAQIVDESRIEESELTMDEAIRRGLLIASIETNKRVGIGGVVASLIKYPVKGVERKDIAKNAAPLLREFLSFIEDKSVEDLRGILNEEFPNFQFSKEDEKEKPTYEIEYFFPIGSYFPKIVYYENKTLKTEGEVSLKDLIKNFKVKSDEELMKIHSWMTSSQPSGPKYPSSTGGSYILVITNRPSTSLRLTTGMPWYRGGSCASWYGTAGPLEPMGRAGRTSSWTGWTDMKYMNMMGILFSNNDVGDSDLEEINSDWPLVYDDTCKGRMLMRWGYVSDDKNFLVNEGEYDVNNKIGFSVEPYYGVECKKKTEYQKILTNAIFNLLNNAGLSEKYWNMLHTPHRHHGATDRSEAAVGGGGVSAYGKQIRTARKTTVNYYYYVDEGVDALGEQKNIAMSNLLTIGDAMGLSKRRIPIQVRLALAQNPRIWLYPNAVSALFGLKDLDTNLILLNSPSCTSQQLLEFFNHLGFYEANDQLALIQNILNSESFDEVVENRLINYIQYNPSTFEELFNSNRIYKTLTNEGKVTYSLFLLLNPPITTYGLYYIPFSENTVENMISILSTRNSVSGTYNLIHNLLFAKNINTTNYIKVLGILTRSLKYKKNKYRTDNADSINLVLSSYIINYNLLGNNMIRNYYLAIINAICNNDAEEANSSMIESFIIGNRSKMANFLDRQSEGNNMESLPSVYEYYLESVNIRREYAKTSYSNFNTFPNPEDLGLFLLLNSNENTIQNYTSIEKIGALLGNKNISDFSALSDMTLYSLLSSTIDFENPNLVGEKLLNNPALRINLYKALKNKSLYDRNFTSLIRSCVYIASESFDSSAPCYKESLESYILDIIMNDGYYTFVEQVSEFEDKVMMVSKLAPYLIDINQINELFKESLIECFGEFYNEETSIVRNPLPVKEYLLAVNSGNIDAMLEMDDIINNIKESQEWQNIDFAKFGRILGVRNPMGENLGFCYNPRLPENIQNFIVFKLSEIAKEYEVEDVRQIMGLSGLYLILARNPNLSSSCVQYLLGLQIPEIKQIQNKLAQNPNVLREYLFAEKLSTKNTLFDLFPYEVLMNNHIEQNDFYKLYNYILTLLKTNISPKTFNMNQFISEKVNPYLSFEKGLDLRKSIEELFYTYKKDIFYWRGGFNLAKKFSKIEDINYWMRDGGEGGIADNPLVPSKQLQQFSILKWDSDKSKNILLNIENHKIITDKLIYVEGQKTSFDESHHLQTIPFGENMDINRLFGYIPEDARTPTGNILYCNICLERTTQKGKPVKYRFNTMEDATSHKENKHPEEEDFISEPDKVKKWTHECIFTIIDNQPPPQELRIPDWRYTLTPTTFKNLINTIGDKIGSIAMFDRIFDSLPISCNIGGVEIQYKTEDMIKNINLNYSWSVDFIDDNLDLLCNTMQNESGNLDMWSNFIFTSDFIEHSIGLFNDNPENYSNLMIYILNCIDLNIISYSDLEELKFNISDINTLIMINRFLSEVKF